MNMNDNQSQAMFDQSYMSDVELNGFNDRLRMHKESILGISKN